MKISERLFERVMVSVESDTYVSRDVVRKVLLSAFESLGIEVEQCKKGSIWLLKRNTGGEIVETAYVEVD